MHRSFCKRNDFADALDEREPQFASWMRKHQKQAVVKVRWVLGGGSRARWVALRAGTGWGGGSSWCRFR